MYCINFKSAPEFIPVGTLVSDPKVSDLGTLGEKIKFNLKAKDKIIKIRIRDKWHPGKTV